jgi:hypothetical protein
MTLTTRTCWLLLPVLAVGAVRASRLAAQVPRLSVGGGLTIPAGGYGTADGTGWHVIGAVLAWLSTPLGLRVDALYGRTPRQGLETGHTWLGGGTASIVWRLPRAEPTLRPYLLTGLGIYTVGVVRAGAPSTSRTGVAWSGGGGLSLMGLGPALGFVEARFMTIRTSGGATNLFPISAGFVVR